MYGWERMQEMVGINWVLAQGIIYALGLVPFTVSSRRRLFLLL